MAHRKPLGTTCHAHFPYDAWGGERPDLLDYLVSEAGTAYMVVGIAEGPKRIRYLLERVADVPSGRKWFGFYWVARVRSLVRA